MRLLGGALCCTLLFSRLAITTTIAIPTTIAIALLPACCACKWLTGFMCLWRYSLRDRECPFLLAAVHAAVLAAVHFRETGDVTKTPAG
jgi:hypothetical protein